MTQKAIKKPSFPKGTKLTSHKGNPTTGYLADLKRWEEFRKTISKWEGKR